MVKRYIPAVGGNAHIDGYNVLVSRLYGDKMAGEIIHRHQHDPLPLLTAMASYAATMLKGLPPGQRDAILARLRSAALSVRRDAGRAEYRYAVSHGSGQDSGP